MSRYAMHLDWDDLPSTEAESRKRLESDTLEAAKMEAALLFALTDFKAGLPSGYAILQNDETTVYRYPEGPVT